MTDVFRFISIRPAQRTQSGEKSDNTILLLNRSRLIEALREARSPGAAGKMIAIARDFTASDLFVRSRRTLDVRYAALSDAIHDIQALGFGDRATQAIKQFFNATPVELESSEDFGRAFVRLSDSVVAAAIDDQVPPAVRSVLVRLVRTFWLVHTLAAGARVFRSGFTRARVVMPAGIFPLPINPPSPPRRPRGNEAERRRWLERVATSLAAHRHASEELIAAIAQTSPESGIRRASRRTSGFVLPASTADMLSAATRELLEAAGVDVGRIDVARTVALLDRKARRLSRQLHAEARGGAPMVRVGNCCLPSDIFGGTLTMSPGPGSDTALLPGPCPPQPAGPLDETGVTVPTGHGDARVLGIADLIVLEQTLLRYELGEIAHIENVLLNERRSRRFRIAKTTEQTEVVETETIETNERDLSSSERFELQTESETVITEEASRSAGITVSASYGPSVDVTSNFNISSSTSKEESSRAASTYAREVTTKAVNRVQERMLKRRTVRTVSETEEVNMHGFDNRGGAGDIVGIYRFVNKIYRAQAVNYGKRLMLEFLVPEPAAFVRYAMSRRPMDDGFPTKPDPPGYCLGDGVTFAALQPEDIDPDHYDYWAARYGAQDVGPAPPALVIATAAKKSPEQMPLMGSRKINSDLLDVAILEGYLCQSAFVNLYGET